MGGIQTHADAAQPGLAKLGDVVGARPVGVDVKNSAVGNGAHAANCFGQGVGHQKGLALAALAKRHDRVRSLLEVVQGDVGNLLGVRDELQAKVRAVHVFVFLKRNAAQAGGVAGGRRRDGQLPALEKEVLGGAALVAPGALRGQVLN